MFYIKMTSEKPGPLSIFHLYGSEAALSGAVDVLVGPKDRTVNNPLILNELRYGWLASGAGAEAVDEVMLAKPAEGMRALMTHGGASVAAAVRGFFAAAGIVDAADSPESLAVLEERDFLFDTVASACLTEAQAGAVLEWRAGGGKPPEGLMATHRVVLAGAPNAGKSSLLNALSGYERAFVHAEAGATRDVVDELADVGGYVVWIGDLPGYSPDAKGSDIEGEAWRRAGERLRLCEMVWFVADGSRPWPGEAAMAVAAALSSSSRPEVVVVVNKSDLPQAWTGEPWREAFPGTRAVRVCSLPDGNASEAMAALADDLWGDASR